MLTAIPDVLTADEVARVRAIIDAAEWVDGSATSGPQAALVKRNAQLPEGSAAAREAGALVLAAIQRSPPFIAAALPAKVYPPLFNRYAGGQSFGTHVDNALRQLRGTDFRLRTDLSATLFLEPPEQYDGGELEIEGSFGTQSVKLPAGHMIVYPSTSLHRVAPVTRGARVAAFFWLQSMVRDDGERLLLFQLDTTIQRLTRDRGGGDAAVVELTGVYHNLLRRWADA